MFTGIISALADVMNIDGNQLEIHASQTSSQVEIGDSVAVNGVCLTVARIEKSSGIILFDLSDETLERTNLSDLNSGSRVNIELALAMGDRLGGHWVQGHVDALGEFCGSRSNNESDQFRFKYDVDFEDLIVEKGSIAIDGVSLTPFNVGEGTFEVAVIPHTLSATALQDLKPGDKVNVEFDILGKYIRKQLRKEA